MATLESIAQAAGVSKATVSLALNGKPGVSPRTRQRILEIAKKLNYQPNASAQGLAKQRTETVGVIVPDISSPFYAELVRGVEEEVSAHGYYLILCTTTGKPSREELYFQLFQTQRVDGIIIMTPREDDRALHQIHDKGFPIVVVDREVASGDDIVEVLVDNFHGSIAAMEHLLDLGYKRIGFINGVPTLAASQERLRGYRLVLQEHDITPRDEWLCTANFREDGGYHCMRQLLSADPSLDAVFVASDLMALGAIKALREEGKRVPDDIAIIGFDDIPLASTFDPPLTTVRQPMEKMGAMAARLLFQLINGEKLLERKVILQTELVVRASCGADYERR
jgi:LacI family transcriptional regulator